MHMHLCKHLHAWHHSNPPNSPVLCYDLLHHQTTILFFNDPLLFTSTLLFSHLSMERHLQSPNLSTWFTHTHIFWTVVLLVADDKKLQKLNGPKITDPPENDITFKWIALHNTLFIHTHWLCVYLFFLFIIPIHLSPRLCTIMFSIFWLWYIQLCLPWLP